MGGSDFYSQVIETNSPSHRSSFKRKVVSKPEDDEVNPLDFTSDDDDSDDDDDDLVLDASIFGEAKSTKVPASCSTLAPFLRLSSSSSSSASFPSSLYIITPSPTAVSSAPMAAEMFARIEGRFTVLESRLTALEKKVTTCCVRITALELGAPPPIPDSASRLSVKPIIPVDDVDVTEGISTPTRTPLKSLTNVALSRQATLSTVTPPTSSVAPSSSPSASTPPSSLVAEVRSVASGASITTLASPALADDTQPSKKTRGSLGVRGLKAK